MGNFNLAIDLTEGLFDGVCQRIAHRTTTRKHHLVDINVFVVDIAQFGNEPIGDLLGITVHHGVVILLETFLLVGFSEDVAEFVDGESRDTGEPGKVVAVNEFGNRCAPSDVGCAFKTFEFMIEFILLSTIGVIGHITDGSIYVCGIGLSNLAGNLPDDRGE